MIPCPTCGAPSVVLDTRGGRRRRQCERHPEHMFATVEMVVKVGAAPRGRPPKARPLSHSLDRWADLR